ncbi:domain-containing [Fusarium albosuccineum]|uniref:Domain-containing n=1 Tax=Fusarium albosuccineum TaxID=1237068 RepID=A0A8H4LHL9_9HYPO|nr:domain-containing [Fusarium albosuccineum]
MPMRVSQPQVETPAMVPSSQKARKRGDPRIQSDSSELVRAILAKNCSQPAPAKGVRRHKKTLALEKRVWTDWTNFVELGNLNSDEIWLKLCAGSHEAVQKFQSFLEVYATKSTTRVPCLGPDEYKTKRVVNSAATLQDVWCALIRVANEDVLERFRYQPHSNPHYYTLRYSTRRGQAEQGPASLVANLIPEIADNLGLTRQQQFEKKETTVTDLLLILRTTWERASDIPCKPFQRVSFSANIILGGIGGWRYQSLMNVKYKDVEVAWLRDPADPKTLLPVANIRIRHVKKSKNEIARDQAGRLSFGITQVPVKSICLLSHIVAMAIYNNAFVTEFKSCEEVLYPKISLEDDVELVPLKWKKEVLDQPLFTLDYHNYWKIWHRVLEVVGLREELRPYSIRVGAGSRLNGALEPALRGYIMGNTDAVFKKSYNPVNQRHSLMTVAYKELTGGCDEIITKLHESFTRRDCHAPIYISEEDWKGFDSRKDITQWRKELSAFSDRSCKEAEKIKSKIQTVKKTLEKELIKQRREEYFEAADLLRSEGQSTSRLHQPRPRRPGPRQSELSSRMAEDLSPLFLAKDPTKSFADELVRYLRLAPHQEEPSKDPSDAEETKPEVDPARSVCFICYKDFSRREGLTRHVKSQHSEDFEKPFSCRECKFSGTERLVPAGLSAWSSHVEQCHGKLHAPNLAKQVRCLLCDKTFSAVGFSLHLNRAHFQLGHFETSFPCPECRRLDAQGLLVEDLNQWISHVKDIHESGAVPGAVVIGMPDPEPRKRKAEEPNQDQQTRAKKLSVEAAVKNEPGKWSCGSEDIWKTDEATWDWGITGNDCHADTEFWVTGRDEDY